MLGGVSSVGYGAYSYRVPYVTAHQAVQSVARGAAVTTTAVPVSQPEMPVTPVEPVRSLPRISDVPLDKADILRRLETDPAAMAVRSRIRYLDQGEDPLQRTDDRRADGMLNPETEAASGKESMSAQEVAEEAECQTCKERKYQDGSDDPGVSFKTAAHIAPEQAAATVRGHEYEHVVRERAKAVREDRRVVSQSVTYHTGICPECGRVYVSGGTTRTVTAGNAAEQYRQQQEEAEGSTASGSLFSAAV